MCFPDWHSLYWCPVAATRDALDLPRSLIWTHHTHCGWHVWHFAKWKRLQRFLLDSELWQSVRNGLQNHTLVFFFFSFEQNGPNNISPDKHMFQGMLLHAWGLALHFAQKNPTKIKCLPTFQHLWRFLKFYRGIMKTNRGDFRSHMLVTFLWKNLPTSQFSYPRDSFVNMITDLWLPYALSSARPLLDSNFSQAALQVPIIFKDCEQQ